MLIVRYSVELTAARFGITVEKVNESLASARAKMAEVRKTRPCPQLDTKMLASWNGKVHTILIYASNIEVLAEVPLWKFQHKVHFTSRVLFIRT